MIQPQHDQEACDTVETMAYDTAGLREGRAVARARMAWPGRESQYKTSYSA